MAKNTKEEKSKGKQLAEKLLVTPQHSADADKDSVKKAQEFCEGYKEFLDKGKTEREAVAVALKKLKAAGYTEMQFNKKYNPGDKIYYVNRERAIIAATIGKKSLEQGAHLSIAHVDSPRLDLKPNPLYENSELSYFKTHYYGGIRKYQWVTIPLSMHGVVMKADGTKVDITIGEQEGDPVFCITDLLPHLSKEQNKRSLSEGIKGEELNILLGSLPFEEEEVSERVKLETMRLLHEKYGITEQDFVRADIEFVPAFPAKDIGFDRSLLGAYGQDDRVCAYTALMAEIDAKNPAHTTVCVLTDKEETGSDGNTGLAGDFLFHFLQDLAESQMADYRRMLQASLCLSADVNAAYDPTFPDVYEKRNTSLVNHGVVITKYTGSGGKYSTSEASAEVMGYVTGLLTREKIDWQVGELGKVDGGGGGTIAKFVANRDVDVVDVGVPVLSMHSPMEVTSKLDVYTTYRCFLAFAMDERK